MKEGKDGGVTYLQRGCNVAYFSLVKTMDLSLMLTAKHDTFILTRRHLGRQSAYGLVAVTENSSAAITPGQNLIKQAR
jgi:hypothetical protein